MKEKFKIKKYKILMAIVVLLTLIVGINKLGHIDINSGKVKLKTASIKEDNKLAASVIEAKGYEIVKYPVLYTLEKVEGIEDRTVIIKGSLNKDESKYAYFKEINEENVTSTLKENGREIEVKIEKVKLGKENSINLILAITGAPNEYKINPRIEIKEISEEKYTKLNTKEIQVKTNSVTGIITDEKGMSVSNIEISLQENNKEIKRTYTDENGRYVFSDIKEGIYTLKVEEEIYEIIDSSEIEVKEGIEKNISVKRVEPYKINVKKYINRVKIKNNGKIEEYNYDKLQKVVQSVKRLNEIEGEIEYKVVVKNEGTKEGIITKIEEELDSALTFNKEKNKSWEEKEGKLYSRSLEGLTLKKGETKEITLIADITKTNEAKVYLSKVTVKGEVYEKVSYILDGKEYKNEDVLEGEKLVDPKLQIENFSGWYTDINYTNKYNFDNSVTKDLILYGKTISEVKKYNVTYIDDGKVIKTEELEEGSLLTAPDVTKEGYTFDGWYEGEEKYDILLPVTKDLILESKYNINSYKIIFKNDNGDILQEETLNYGETPVYKKEEPSKNKTDEFTYTFKSWDKEITNVIKDEIYTAVFESTINKYKVTYMIEGEEYYSETLEYGSIVLEKEKPNKDGYTFDGWYKTDDTKQEYPIILTKDITLYGKYKINTYTVRFFDKDTEIKEFEQKIEYQNEVKEPELAPTLEDYKFVGWVIKGTDIPYVFGTPVENDIDLESKFTKKPTYLVTFNIEGNTDIIMGEEVIEGKVATKPTPDPFKKGYTFDGWYKDNTYSVKYDFNEKVMNNIEIYGRYIENSHTVTYHNEDEIYNVEKVLDSYTATKPSVNPTKEGYTFKYWSKEENGVEYSFNNEVKTDIDLYAVYEINTYEIVFKNYDGTILQRETLNYGEMPVYKGETPVKEKTDEYTYVFSSWNKEITNVTKNEEYTAVYTNTKNKYIITFVNYNGEELQSEDLEYGIIPVYKGETPVKEKTDEYTYTFKSWDKEITNVTKNQTYVAVFDSVKNKYTVVYMDGDSEYTRKEVDYGSVVTEEIITKDHQIYRGWTLDNQIFDFSTPITNNITLYSSYELVEAPVITHTPALPNWTNDKVVVTINSNHNDYDYIYKIDAGEYQEYTGPFEVSENSTIVAKSIKEDVESDFTTHDITNIDKIDPKLIELNEDNISVNSFDVKIKAKDNESGMSEIRIYKNEELITRYTYNNNLNEEKEEKYNFTSLNENTTYNIKIEVEDKVGNTVSESKNITTKERIIVARVIGRNNSLYENEESYELFESLKSAIESCGANQCTIQMVLDTNESADILDGQDITLDINGKIIDGERNYTIQNRGNLILVDNAEEKGVLSNKNDVAIKNIGMGVLQIGENEEPLAVSVEKPNIVGNNYGIYTEDKTATFKFYDGKIEGNVAIQGDVNDTPYLYNAGITSTDHQIATLSILADAEARITGGKYYTKLTGALDESIKGSYKEELTTENIMSNFVTPGMYGFVYDKESKSLLNTNTNVTNTVANSYIKLDLTNYEYDQELVINAYMQGANNYDFGYATITDSKDIPAYNQTEGRFIYITGNVEETDYRVILEKGKSYYLHIGYRNGSYTPDLFKINSITLNDYIVVNKEINYETDLISSGDYTFVYDSETKTLKNNNNLNNTQNNNIVTLASAYLIYDLTSINNDKKLLINAQINGYNDSRYAAGYVTVTNSSEVPSYDNEENRYIFITGNQEARNYEVTLKANQVNYVHIGFRRYGVSGSQTFTINSISDLNRGVVNVDYTGSKENITLNEQVDVVQLLKDITLTEPLTISEVRDVVLDLKGNTLTTSANDYVIKNYGNLKIIDSKFDDDTNSAQARFEEQQAIYDEQYQKNMTRKEEKEAQYQKDLEKYNEYISEFNYTGDYQEFVAPITGQYKIELWGAQGGSSVGDGLIKAQGGLGGYTKGIVNLKKGDKLYIYVGEKGKDATVGCDSKASYNGGGLGTWDNSDDEAAGAGGGSTDIRLVSGNWNNFDSLKSRIMVAGAGGGASWTTKGGDAGGLEGNSTNPTATAGSQISGYKFGIGQDGYGVGDSDGVGGAGSGYYGGSTSDSNNGEETGAGGSSFISGHEGCDAIAETSTEDNIIHTGQSIHYSDISFENAIMKAGNEQMPTYDGTSTMIGNTGDGHAKITLLNDNDGNISIPTTKPIQPTNGYTTKDYVQDNLQLHLDGITSASSSIWKDLSNNQKHATLDRTTYQDNYYNFDGNYSMMSINNPVIVSTEATLQLSISSQEKRNGVVYSDKNSNIGFAIYGDNFSVTTRNYTNLFKIPTDFFNGEIKNVSIIYNVDRNDNTLYVNNEEIEKVNSTYYIGTSFDNITIGGNSNGWRFKGNIYSVRVYDRILSREEIEKNNDIDTYRFKGIIRKQAKLDSVVQTGNITSTTNGVIYNHNTGNLLVRRGIINLNANGSYSAITNNGILKLEDGATINLEQYDNIGVKNSLGGTILSGNGTINANRSGSRQYGIYNDDYLTKEISGYIIYTNNNTGFYQSNKGITLDNFTFKGTGEGITTNSVYVDSETNIKNSLFNGPNVPVNMRTNISNTVFNESQIIHNTGDIKLDNIEITNTNKSGISSVNRSTYTIDISGGKITTNYTSIDIRYNKKVVNINNTTVTSTNNNAMYVEDAIVNINGATVTSQSNSLQVGNNGTVNINSGSITSTNNNAMYVGDNATINIGVKGSPVSTTDPVITGKIYGVYNNSDSRYPATINFYDGIVTGNNNAIYGVITDFEENYDLKVTREEERESAILQEPSNYIVQIGETKYTSIQEAINNVESNAQIDILNDIDTLWQVIIPNDKNITLNLNGHKIKSYSSNSFIINNGTLTIKDSVENGTIQSNGVEILENNGTLNIESGTIKSDIDITTELIKNNNIMNITGGKITTRISGGNVISNEESGTLNITGGIVEGNNRGTVIKNKGTLTATDGTIIGNYMRYHPTVIEIPSTGTTRLSGSIKIEGLYAIANAGTTEIENITIPGQVNNYDAGKITIDGGTINNTISNNNSATVESKITLNNVTVNSYIQNSGYGVIEINGGEITSTSGTAISNSYGTININGTTVTANNNYAIVNSNSGIININSGEIISTNNIAIQANYGTINIGVKGSPVSTENPVITGKIYGVYNNSDSRYPATINFYDGTITGQTAISGAISEVEEGYDIVDADTPLVEGSQTKMLAKLPVAKLLSTNEEYYSIQEAVNAVTNSNDTIQVIRDLTTMPTTESIEVPESKNIILDINGHKLQVNNDKFIINNGTLKIKDSVENGTIQSNGVEVLENNGTLTIESGTIKSDIGLTSKALIKNNSVMNITGGNIKATIDTGTTITNEEGSTLNITGGIVEGERYYGLTVILNKGTLNATNGTIKGISSYTSTLISTVPTGTTRLSENINIEGSVIYNQGTTEIENIILNSGVTNSLSGQLTIKGGTVNGGIGNDSYATADSKITLNNVTVNSYVENKGYGVIEMNGGEITSNNLEAIRSDHGTVNINGTTVTSSSNAIIVYGNATVNINSGNITSTNGKAIEVNSGTVNIGEKGGEVSTTDPVITGKTYGVHNYSNSSNPATINFYDGTITGQTAIQGTINEVEEGYNIVDAETPLVEGSQTKILAKQPVARILSTNKEYYSLQEAINDVTQERETIQIIRDLTTTPTTDSINVPEEKNIILDISGFRFNVSNEKFIINNGTLTIKDSVENGTIQSNGVEVLENNGTLTIESGTIIPLVALNGKSLIINNGIMNITGGDMKSTVDIGAIITNEEGSTLNITGGTIEEIKHYGFTVIVNKGTLNATGGTIKGISSYTSTLISTVPTGTTRLSENINIEGSVIYNQGTTEIENIILNSGVTNSLSGQLTIKGGTVNGGIGNDSYATADSKITLNNVTVNSYVENNGYGVIDINGGEITSNNRHAISAGYGIVNINGTTVTSSSNAINISSSGIVNINSGNITSTDGTAINIYHTATLNINSGSVTSTNNDAIHIYSGTVNIGVKGSPVSTENPKITGKTYGVYNDGTTGKTNFYDGIISGETSSIYGVVNEVEPGYKITTNTEESIIKATLILVGDNEKVAVLNGINFTKLQDAVNSASNTEESIITLYANIILDSNITVPSGKNIKLVLNGYTLTKGSYDFVGEGNITLIDNTEPTSVLASIVQTVKDVLNINEITKNIIIYEMDDGSKLSSEKTYRLYNIGDTLNEVNLEELEIGKYIISNQNDQIRTVKNRIYLNNLGTGKYKLMSNTGEEINFEITDDNKLVGKVKENTSKDINIVTTAIAELIIMIATGISVSNYVLLMFLIMIIITLLYLIIRQKIIT